MPPTWHAVTTHERSRAGKPPEVYATEPEAEAAGRRMVAAGAGAAVVYAIPIPEETR